MNAGDDRKALINALSTMSKPRLRRLWQEQFGSAPNPRLCVVLMRPVLAYRIQEAIYRSGSRSTERCLLHKYVASNIAKPRYKQGTRIVREWKGKVHEVAVTPEGYEYRGTIYKSLSPIANLITGTRWSGPAFFGTKPQERRK
jgi:Protein of unknown function (DUF2924)